MISRIAERVNVSRVPCGFHKRLLDPAISSVSRVGDPKPGLRESGLGCRVPQRAMMSAPSEILIRITSGYGLRIKTEIPRMFDEARVLAPETARLWVADGQPQPIREEGRVNGARHVSRTASYQIAHR